MDLYVYGWIFATAVIFTFVGYSMGKKSSRSLVELAIATTIDSLIRDGYLKTRGVGKNMEILKADYDQTD
jgi:hypothetical protein